MSLFEGIKSGVTRTIEFYCVIEQCVRWMDSVMGSLLVQIENERMGT